jgi:hypothetical protein
MGWFDNTLGAVSGLFEESAAAVGDVVEDIGTAIFGSTDTRGSAIGAAVGSAFGYPGAGAAIGEALSRDIAVAPERAKQLTADDIAGQVSQADYDNIQALRDQMDYAAQQPTVYEGTVLDIRYPSMPVTAGLPRLPTGVGLPTTAAIGAGMDLIEGISEFFGMSDDPGAYSNAQMCRPAAAKAFSVNRNTGCISITRKQQAKLKELVRMVGIEQASKQIGLPVSMTSQLLLKTFRSRRKGISGADIRAVKRVDRQMHSLACALGGISSTSRAVASRKAPPKRSC